MSKPSMPETDYKQMWKNYSGYLADAQARYEKSSGIARAKMAQSGVQQGTSAWASKMKTIEDTYAADLKEISSTVTGTMLAENFKKEFKSKTLGADLKLARSLANMSKTERRAAADTMKAGWDREADQDIYGGRYGYIQKEQKAIDLAGGNFFLDLAERQAAGEKINFSDPKLLSQYYGRMYKSGQGEIAKEAKANQALERAKTAASGGQSAASAMTAEAAQEEQKKNIVNPWL